ncbi:MAG: Glu-tRNA(Gln) amidotransferase subunit GatE [Thermoplasmata archaeon]|nr:Glu-tRNA(Gln) amidotransferase subunit GatE [Thermoplasmata archaeon]
MKAGLEVHQQLATRKLFCPCPSELSEEVEGTVRRRLRATGGELRALDPAAAFESSLGQSFVYEVGPTTCLVDLDEEPPHAINAEALDVALTVALLLHATPIDEILVMRKLVVDGSNTSGFQRTALIAVNGWLEVGGHRISIDTICLEEDAARKVSETGGEVRYRLDRLGIPLVEVATGPDLTSPEQVRDVAQAIGALLRSTHRVRRGIGTIREDLNLSIEGGTRVELKGVQELRLLPKYSLEEIARQEMLLRAKEELHRRSAKPSTSGAVDVSDLLHDAGPGPVASSLKKGGVVLAALLPGFGGLLGRSADVGPRLGRELADYARTAGVRGILHSDELPSDGVEASHVETIRHRLSLGPHDAFALVASTDAAKALGALQRVIGRAALAWAGVPPETRDPLPDGTSRYSRPLPGRDRMYPETDVPPVTLSVDHLATLASQLPEGPEETRRRIREQYALTEEVAGVLLREGETDRFEALIRKGHAPAFVVRLLTHDLPALAAMPRSEPLSEPSEAVLDAILTAWEKGEFAKEGVQPVLEGVLVHGRSLGEAAASAGLAPMSRPELEALVEMVLDRDEPLWRARGKMAQSPLMGDVMREVRGRRDGKEVAEVLEKALTRRLEGQSRTP